MGLLRVRNLALILFSLGTQVFFPVPLLDCQAAPFDGFAGERRGVRTHIRDVPVLVESLCDLHRTAGGQM